MIKETFNDIPTIEKGLYRHYKGHVYRVLGVGCHSETLEYYVVYAPVEQKEGIPEMWLRPYGMFLETTEIDGKTRPRFEKLSQQEL